MGRRAVWERGRAGRPGLQWLGKKESRRVVVEAVPALMAALLADYVVLVWGNAKRLMNPPPGSRLSNNLTAFRGGFRLWHVEAVRTLSGEDRSPEAVPAAEWRLI